MKKVLILLLCGYVTNVMGDCNAGQYDDGSGCTDCPTGTFSSTTNAPSCTDLSTCAASENKYLSQAASSAGGVANIGYTSGFTSAYYVALNADGSENAVWGSKTTADANTVNLKKAIATSAPPASGDVFLKQDGTISGTAGNADGLYPIGDTPGIGKAPGAFGLEGGIEIIEKVQKNNGIGIIFFNSQSGFYCDVGVSQLAKCSNNHRENVVKYAAIQNFGVCILKTDNAVECKGYIAGYKINPLNVADVKDLESIPDSFAAVKTDGSVVAWSRYGLSTISSGADKIFSTKYAFAVINTDKSVHAWGDSSNGGDASGVQNDLTDVQTIFSTDRAFAALKTDKSVVAWGNAAYGGDASGVTLTNVETIFSTDGAFAALKTDGSVEVWGGADYGGDASGLDLTNVQTIYSTERSFAALKTDGSVVSWGKIDASTEITDPDIGPAVYTSDVTCTDCAAGTHTTTDNADTCDPNVCECEHGTKVEDGVCTSHGATECVSCNSPYVLSNGACVLVCPMSAPANGALGDCVSPLASGATCAPTCDAGYMLSGINSCASGTLTAAECIPYPEYPSDCLSGQVCNAGTCDTDADTIKCGWSDSGCDCNSVNPDCQRLKAAADGICVQDCNDFKYDANPYGKSEYCPCFNQFNIKGMNYAKIDVSAIPSYQDNSYDYTTIAKVKTTYANFQSDYNTDKAHPVSIDAVDASDGTFIFPIDCRKPEMEEFCLSTMNSCKIFEQSDENFAVLHHELLDSNDQPINSEILNDDGSGEVWWTSAEASTVYTNLLGLIYDDDAEALMPQVPTVAWAPDDDDFMEYYDVPYDNGEITESAWQEGFDAFLDKNIFECFCDSAGTCLGD